MDKYVLFIPGGGFNDCLTNLHNAINYCKKYKRILLFDTINSTYKINFIDYFGINEPNMIYDFNQIKSLCNNNNFSVYPNCLNTKLIDILEGKIRFKYEKDRPGFSYNTTILSLPAKIINEDIIIYSRCGGGNGFEIFKRLSFKNNIKEYCKQKYSLLEKRYLYIHVRNTDIKCNYQELYLKNKNLIHSYNTIYVATDDKEVIEYFKSQNLTIFNFCKFPESGNYQSLHTSNVNPDEKIKSLICDIYIAIMSEKILSTSKGGFINLLRHCYNNKKLIENKF